MSTSFYAAWADHYDDVFPPGPKSGFVAARFTAPALLLDVGCATGAMGVALCVRGFQVHGVDLDSALVARAQARASSPDLSFAQGDMLALPSPPRPFDAVICLGNTLVHLLEREQRVAALRDMAAQVRPGGGLLVQIVNYDRVLEGRVDSLPLIDNQAVRFERRYFDVSPGGLRFHARLTVKASGHVLTVEQPLFPLTRGALAAELREAGWEPGEWWGGYGEAAWSAGTMGCIVKARLRR